MEYKRLTIVCGHYGTGKSNVAVNMALDLKKQHNKVVLADLDIVNPYFRSVDSADELKNHGIRIICSDYANSNVDIPALPSDIYSIVDNKDEKAVLDIGGDDRGALVLGRLTPKILEENDYNMLMVINCYRPLTKDALSTIEVMREIEDAAHIKFTGFINNSNLGEETTEQCIIDSFKYADDVTNATNLPVFATTVKEDIYLSLKNKYDNLFPIKLQKKIF